MVGSVFANAKYVAAWDGIGLENMKRKFDGDQPLYSPHLDLLTSPEPLLSPLR
jgi:hypothetical protein